MTDSENEDWRLQATVAKAHGDTLDDVIKHARSGDTGPAVAEDIVLTHDGDKLFAYASNRAALDDARGALEAALKNWDLTIEPTLSLWDERLDLWRQVDPPLAESDEDKLDSAELQADEEVTRTLVASAGRFVEEEFERTMVDAANRLGIAYRLVEHKHLLTTQVAFTVKGPQHAVGEFERQLRAAARTTVRCQEEVGFSL